MQNCSIGKSHLEAGLGDLLIRMRIIRRRALLIGLAATGCRRLPEMKDPAAFADSPDEALVRCERYG